MNNSGDAAEQIVRMSLEGTEVALRLSGAAAKNVAAALYTVAKDSGKNQTKGQQKLNTMLRSGKELKVFTINENDLKRFAEESKRYGVVYCVLQKKGRSPDGNMDILVRAEDAAKINRIVERFKLSAVDTASIRHEIEQKRAERSEPASKDADELLVDEMLQAPAQKEQTPGNPTMARTENESLSEPILQKQGNGESTKSRPSVREELRQIKAAHQKAAEKPQQREATVKQTPFPVQVHRDPGKKKPKVKVR